MQNDGCSWRAPGRSTATYNVATDIGLEILAFPPLSGWSACTARFATSGPAKQPTRPASLRAIDVAVKARPHGRADRQPCDDQRCGRRPHDIARLGESRDAAQGPTRPAPTHSECVCLSAATSLNEDMRQKACQASLIGHRHLDDVRPDTDRPRAEARDIVLQEASRQI